MSGLPGSSPEESAGATRETSRSMRFDDIWGQMSPRHSRAAGPTCAPHRHTPEEHATARHADHRGAPAACRHSTHSMSLSAPRRHARAAAAALGCHDAAHATRIHLARLPPRQLNQNY